MEIGSIWIILHFSRVHNADIRNTSRGSQNGPRKKKFSQLLFSSLHSPAYRLRLATQEIPDSSPLLLGPVQLGFQCARCLMSGYCDKNWIILLPFKSKTTSHSNLINSVTFQKIWKCNYVSNSGINPNQNHGALYCNWPLQMVHSTATGHCRNTFSYCSAFMECGVSILNSSISCFLLKTSCLKWQKC